MWKSRRRAAALVQGIVILALPFVRAGGESAVRFDIPGMRLFLFGAVVWIDEFHLVLAGALFLLLLGIGVTVILGRVWCGWICPQTVIPDLAAWAASPLPERAGRTARAVLLARQPHLSLSVQWVGQVPGAHVNSYRYVLRNRGDAPVSLELDVDGAFELIGGRKVSIPPRSRAGGEVMVRKAGEAGGSVTFLASAPGIGLRGKAGFP